MDNDDNTYSEEILNILKAVENDNNEHIINHSRASIQRTKNNILQQLHLKPDKLKSYHAKLKDYMYIDDLRNIHYGSYIRWINIKNPDKLNLTNGGIICDVKFYEDGVQILCKNALYRMFQIKFDECIIFQKLTDQEQVLLDVMQYLDKNKE